VVGLINLPIIKYSVEWWNTLHQPATFTVTEAPAMPMTMWLPLLLSTLGMYGFIAAVAMWRMQTEVLVREHRSNWVKKEVLGNGI
jgi:heme exporter protein C